MRTSSIQYCLRIQAFLQAPLAITARRTSGSHGGRESRVASDALGETKFDVEQCVNRSNSQKQIWESHASELGEDNSVKTRSDRQADMQTKF